MERTVPLVLFCAFAAEAVVFAAFGRPVIDEGVYINAASRVFDGFLPYRDFPFSQGPTLPYIYSGFAGALDTSIAVGRAVCCAGWIATGLAAACLAQRLAGRVAATWVLALLMLNLPALWVGTTLRTQGLSTLLVVLAALALSVRWRNPFGFALAPSLLLWSTGIRLTNALALIAVVVWTAWRLRDKTWKPGALLAGQALLLFAPLLAAPSASWFHIWIAQRTRSERGGLRSGDTLSELLHSKVAFAFTPATDYFPIPALALVVVGGLAWSTWRGWRPDASLPLRDGRTAQLVLVALSVLVFAPHLLFEQVHFPYFIAPSVLLSVAIAIGAPGWAGATRGRAWAVYAAVGALLVAGGVGAVREWPTWLSNGPGGVARLREVGAELRQLAGPDCSMVTFQTHLAVETGCRVLPGLEYSLFSFFPDPPPKVKGSQNVLTPERLERRIGELHPELIVASPTVLARLGARPHRHARSRPQIGSTLGEPGSAWAAYRLAKRYRIGSGARLPFFPDSIRVDAYVRQDLVDQEIKFELRDGP